MKAGSEMLLKSSIGLVPALMLLLGSLILLRRTRTASALLLLLGAGGGVIVMLAHICEALQLFPGMRWGQPQSPGHYVDLAGALLVVSLFPLGYLLHTLGYQHS